MFQLCAVYLQEESRPSYGELCQIKGRVEDSQRHDRICLSYHSQLVMAKDSSVGYLRSLHKLRDTVDANRAFPYDTFS